MFRLWCQFFASSNTECWTWKKPQRLLWFKMISSIQVFSSVITDRRGWRFWGSECIWRNWLLKPWDQRHSNHQCSTYEYWGSALCWFDRWKVASTTVGICMSLIRDATELFFPLSPVWILIGLLSKFWVGAAAGKDACLCTQLGPSCELSLPRCWRWWPPT